MEKKPKRVIIILAVALVIVSVALVLIFTALNSFVQRAQIYSYEERCDRFASTIAQTIDSVQDVPGRYKITLELGRGDLEYPDRIKIGQNGRITLQGDSYPYKGIFGTNRFGIRPQGSNELDCKISSDAWPVTLAATKEITYSEADKTYTATITIEITGCGSATFEDTYTLENLIEKTRAEFNAEIEVL